MAQAESSDARLPDVEVTPPLVAGTETVPGCNWTLFRQLPKFNIRNGDVSDVTSVLIRASIATPYHWVPVANLAPADGVAAIDGFIKSHLAYLAANNPAATSDSQRRKIAICLGTARAVSTTFYRLTRNDFIPGELTQPLLSAATDPGGHITYTIRGEPSAEMRAILGAELDLTPEERAAICAIIKCAAGIIPMQGYSLMMTNHHYLSQADTQSRKVYAVVERAYWTSQDVATWFSSDAAVIQDALWHKACHPVAMNLKTDAAMDPTINQKLTQAGAGACASRLPAVETELRSANSYVTLMATVNPMFGICGGSINFDELIGVIETVKMYPPGVMNPEVQPVIPDALRQIITNRVSALAYLSGMLKRNQDMVAYCYGFYVALSESNMMMGGGAAGQGDTLKSSFSLAKLKNQSFASYTAGYQAYGDFQAVRNAKRQKGEFVAPNFVVS